MKTFLIAVLASLSLSVYAQYYSITCDSQNPAEQFVLDKIFSGNTPFLRSYHYDNGVAIDLTPWAMQFYYSYGQFDTNGGVTINGVVDATNRVTYLGATNVFFQAFDRYYFSIKGTHSSGYVKTFATGRMIQDYDPATDTNLITQMGQINMNWWTNNVGIQVEFNRVRIAVFETSKVDRVAFNGTNLIFEGRIASNEAFNVAQALSNAFYEIRISSNETFRITTQSATNAALLLQITNNLAAQANTNSDFQASFNAQANTNAGFQALFANQTATNTALQNQVTLNLTNQNATNTSIQTQVALNLTNQNATNVLLQTGIDSVGTGTWSLALLSDGSRSANYLNIVNTNYLGANIVTNGTFTGSVSNWSLSSFYYSVNRVILNPSLTGSIEYTNTLVVTTNKMYQLTVKTTYAGAAVTASVGGVTSTWTSVNGATRTEYFYAVSDNKILIGASTGTNSLELDDVTLKECPTGSVFVAQDVNAGNVVNARVGVYAPNITAISNDVAVIKTNYFPLQSGLNISNRVVVLETNTLPLQSGLSVSNDVAVIKTNYFPLQSGLNVSNRVVVLETNKVPQPTNAWTAGYVLSSINNGTTTYALAAGAGDFLASGSVPMAGNLNFGGQRGTNAAQIQAITGTFSGVLTLGGQTVLTNEPDHAAWLTNNTYVKSNSGNWAGTFGGKDTNWFVLTNDPTLTNALLLTGTRAMQGNLNMGGQSITNVASNSLAFNDGVSLTSAKIILYDTLDEATNALNIRVNTDLAGATNNLYNATNALNVATNALQVQASALSTGKVDRADTNGWVVSSHADLNAATNALNVRVGTVETSKVDQAGDTMTGTLYLPAASTATNAATRYDQIYALLQAAIPMYLTTNLETTATNDFQYPLKVYKSSEVFPLTVGTCSVTYATLNDYPIGMIYTNQSFTSLPAGKAIFSWWCNENTAGSASHKAEVYIWDTVRKALVEVGEGGPTLPTPSGAASVFQSAEIPYNAVPETNLFYLAGRMKIMVLSGTPTVNFKTGPGFPCSFSFQLPNRALTEGFYQRAGDQLTGPMDANGNIITNGIFAGDGASLSNITAAQVGAASTGDFVNISNRVVNTEGATNALNIATQSLNTAVGNLNNATNALNIATQAINTVANAALPKAGGTMTGPLTNIYKFYGDGGGLTNLAAPTATNSDALGGIAAATWSGSTNALNTSVINLNAATGSLNTAVGNLNNSTNALNIRVNTDLANATNNLYNATNALNVNKLDASFTNTGIMTAAQITGGSPTNGAVWLATSVNGSGKWSLPVGFSAARTEATNFFNDTELTIPWTVEYYDYGGNFNGTTFIAPVNGSYEFVFAATTYLVTGTPALGDTIYTFLCKNGVKTNAALINSYKTAGYPGMTAVNHLEIYLTNGAQVTCSIFGDLSRTNALYGRQSGADVSSFKGYLIRELP